MPLVLVAVTSSAVLTAKTPEYDTFSGVGMSIGVKNLILVGVRRALRPATIIFNFVSCNLISFQL